MTRHEHADLKRAEWLVGAYPRPSLPDNRFSSSGTNVRTVLLTVDRAG